MEKSWVAYLCVWMIMFIVVPLCLLFLWYIKRTPQGIEFTLSTLKGF